MANQWIIQELLAEVNDALLEDTWIIGIVEDERFTEKFRTTDKKWALLLIKILKWWELFELGILVSPAKIKNAREKINT